jgi:hypothetical protein
MNTYTPEIDTLATDWFRRCRESQRVHYEYGSSLEKRNYWLGVPTIILSTAVGTAVFASIESSTASAKYGLWCGLVSMTAAILAALQTFLNLPDRAAKHKAAGARYGAIRRRLEVLKTIPPATADEMRVELAEIKDQMDCLAAEAPGIPSSVKQRIDREMKSTEHLRIFHLKSKSS